MKVFSDNPKAYYNFEITDRFVAGIVLIGQEVKSIRNGRANIAGSYIVIKDEEAFLVGANIPPYQPKNAPSDYDAARSRKLLLEKAEISKLIGTTKEKGIALIPLKLFAKGVKIKLEICVGKGKKKEDKRQSIKKRETAREIERELKSR